MGRSQLSIAAVPLRVDAGFVVLVAGPIAVLWSGFLSFAPQVFEGNLSLSLYGGTLFAAMLILHEVGHIVMLRRLGIRVRVLTLSFLPHVVADEVPDDGHYIGYALGGVIVDGLALGAGAAILVVGQAVGHAAVSGMAGLVVVTRAAGVVFNLWPLPWNDGALALDAWYRLRSDSEAEALCRTAAKGRLWALPLSLCVGGAIWALLANPLGLLYAALTVAGGGWACYRWSQIRSDLCDSRIGPG